MESTQQELSSFGMVVEDVFQHCVFWLLESSLELVLSVLVGITGVKFCISSIGGGQLPTPSLPCGIWAGAGLGFFYLHSRESVAIDHS